MVIVPFGAIASSTLAGNRGLSNTFVAYMKYFISVVFEAVTMALAILLCNQFISSGLPTFTGDYEDWAKTLIYLGGNDLYGCADGRHCKRSAEPDFQGTGIVGGKDCAGKRDTDDTI
jgi:hypothetical protein